MRRAAMTIGLAICALCAGMPAGAQRATERYIPIGKSPGVSQANGLIGTIDSVSVVQRTITIEGPGERRTAAITPKTRIWLDRSRLRQSNVNAAFEDLRRGRRVEVKYLDPDRRIADWVKIEATGS